MSELAFEDIKVGDEASLARTITEVHIVNYAGLTGDMNPVHLDETYAATTRFGKRIAHGMLTASLISALLANDLPGPGTVYLNQTLTFKAPVYIGNKITATVELTNYRNRIATFKTTVHNQDGVLVLEGEAVVLTPENPIS